MSGVNWPAVAEGLVIAGLCVQAARLALAIEIGRAHV